MKTLALVLASLLLPSVAFAQAHGPDFTGVLHTGTIDRSLAASSGGTAIEPSDVITFGLDTTALDEAALSQLDDAAEWLRAFPDHRLVLEGHTDMIGSSDYNVELGRRRADRVRAELMQRGVNGDRILVVVVGAADAHRFEDPSDRRVVMFASTQSMSALATAELDAKRALTVAWTDRGSRLEEQNGLGHTSAIARR